MKRRLADRPLVLIEDSQEDFEIASWAFRQAGVFNPLIRCGNTAEIETLWSKNPDRPSALAVASPLLVLLDLNVPGMDWRETLMRLRADRWWRSVPVIAVSTSAQPATVSDCYGLGAAGYIQKQIDLYRFAAAIASVAAYWLDTVILATHSGRDHCGADDQARDDRARDDQARDDQARGDGSGRWVWARDRV